MKEISNDLQEYSITIMYEDIVLFRSGLYAVSKKDCMDKLRKSLKFKLKDISYE